jgi:hypothetical protein
MYVEHQPGSCLRIYNGSNVLLSPRVNPWRKHQIFTFSFWGKAVNRPKYRVRRNALNSIFGSSSNGIRKWWEFISCKGTHPLARKNIAVFKRFVNTRHCLLTNEYAERFKQHLSYMHSITFLEDRIAASVNLVHVKISDLDYTPFKLNK